LSGKEAEAFSLLGVALVAAPDGSVAVLLELDGAFTSALDFDSLLEAEELSGFASLELLLLLEG